MELMLYFAAFVLPLWHLPLCYDRERGCHQMLCEKYAYFLC